MNSSMSWREQLLITEVTDHLFSPLSTSSRTPLVPASVCPRNILLRKLHHLTCLYFFILRKGAVPKTDLNTVREKQLQHQHKVKKGTAAISQVVTLQLPWQFVQTIVNSHPQVFSLVTGTSTAAHQTSGGYSAYATPPLPWTTTPNSNFSSQWSPSWPTSASCINLSNHGALLSRGIKDIQVSSWLCQVYSSLIIITPVFTLQRLWKK